MIEPCRTTSSNGPRRPTWCKSRLEIDILSTTFLGANRHGAGDSRVRVGRPGLISRQTAMTEASIEDLNAELARIKAEQGDDPDEPADEVSR